MRAITPDKHTTANTTTMIDDFFAQAMTKMLAMVVNERQDDWYLQLPHVEFA